MAVSSSETTFDDLGLANQAKQGDTGAFTELVERYAPRVFRVARHITRNDQDAEDVLQETFLKSYSRLAQFQGKLQILHLAGPHCRQRSADAYPPRQRPHYGFARRGA